MKHLYKRIIGIALYAILGIAVITLAITLMLTINSNTQAINELNSQNAELQSELDSTKQKLKTTESNLASKEKEFEKAVSDIQEAIDISVSYMTEATYWMGKFMNADPDNVTYSYAFDTVEELMAAIKKNPTQYNGKQVKVLGTVIKDDYNGSSLIIDGDGYDYLSIDSSGIDFDFYGWLRNKKEKGCTVKISIADDVQYTVMETGDYVKMYGTVRIANGEIYLANCEYSMITTRDERK